MAELTEDLKLAVVQRLAAFEAPADIVRWLKAEHDHDAIIQQIVPYDPTRGAFRAGDKWRQIFEATRQAFLHDVAAVPIAQQGYRLGILQQNLTKALASKNLVLANATLEQAAKEIGGSFSNVRVNLGDTAALSADERRQMLAELVDKSFGRDATAPGSATPQ